MKHKAEKFMIAASTIAFLTFFLTAIFSVQVENYNQVVNNAALSIIWFINIVLWISNHKTQNRIDKLLEKNNVA